MSKKEEIESLTGENVLLTEENETLKASVAELKAALAKGDETLVDSLTAENASLKEEHIAHEAAVAQLEAELAAEKRREYEFEEIVADIEAATDTVKYQAKTAWSAIKTWRDAKERAGRGETTTEE